MYLTTSENQNLERRNGITITDYLVLLSSKTSSTSAITCLSIAGGRERWRQSSYLDKDTYLFLAL